MFIAFLIDTVGAFEKLLFNLLYFQKCRVLNFKNCGGKPEIRGISGVIKKKIFIPTNFEQFSLMTKSPPVKKTVKNHVLNPVKIQWFSDLVCYFLIRKILKRRLRESPNKQIILGAECTKLNINSYSM